MKHFRLSMSNAEVNKLNRWSTVIARRGRPNGSNSQKTPDAAITGSKRADQTWLLQNYRSSGMAKFDEPCISLLENQLGIYDVRSLIKTQMQWTLTLDYPSLFAWTSTQRWATYASRCTPWLISTCLCCTKRSYSEASRRVCSTTTSPK